MQDLSLFIQNHWVLSISFIVLLTLLFILEFIRQKRGAVQISPLRLTHLINHENALAVDLRPTDVYVKGHIIGALSLPVMDFKENAKKLEKMKTRPIVLVCAKGLDSPKIAASLQDRGFHVHVLKGGIQGWTEANMPLIKGA